MLCSSYNGKLLLDNYSFITEGIFLPRCFLSMFWLHINVWGYDYYNMSMCVGLCLAYEYLYWMSLNTGLDSLLEYGTGLE